MTTDRDKSAQNGAPCNSTIELVANKINHLDRLKRFRIDQP